MNKRQDQNRFSPEEWEAIKVHRYFLSRNHSRYIGIREAIESWRSHYALKWRGERTRRGHLAQIEEIMRYKWIESEKAGHDLGKEAVYAWIERYAGDWRREWERSRGMGNRGWGMENGE